MVAAWAYPNPLPPFLPRSHVLLAHFSPLVFIVKGTGGFNGAKPSRDLPTFVVVSVRHCLAFCRVCSLPPVFLLKIRVESTTELVVPSCAELEEEREKEEAGEDEEREGEGRSPSTSACMRIVYDTAARARV